MKKRFIAWVAILIFCVMVGSLISVSSMVFERTTDNDNRLYLNKDGELTILHLTDLHECLNGVNSLRDNNYNYMKGTILSTKPDLVVFGGDNIFPLSLIGEITHNETLITIDEISKLMDELGQKWTLIFGNHDDEAIFSKKRQTERCMQSKYFIGGLESYSDIDVLWDKSNDMVGNYRIPIYDKGGELVYNVFLLDSGSFRRTGAMTFKKKPNGYWYNAINDNQTKWFVELSQKTNVPSIMFTHIPLQEHVGYYNQIDNKSKVIDYTGEFGGYSVSDFSSSFFKEAIQLGTLRGIFTGHNHKTSMTMLCKTEFSNIILSTTRQCGSYLENDGGMSRVVKITKDDLITYEYDNTAKNIFTYKEGKI